ncbi:kinase-like domain-containing protein [Thelephora terrestris]|uniref:Kinase-like domain-containing protein n=1 Tax=Thelephora terrestris TaxID=56493 RepID=A0A9P6HGA9_9AGAM|nr:kinase-like domain-containing protein [Thelephora terrestris]
MSKIIVSLFNFCIAILNMNAAELALGNEVYRIVSTILALVRDTMIDDEHAMQLSECCFNACETMKGALQGKNPSDLTESEKATMENLERLIHRVECTLRSAASSSPCTKYNQKNVESYMQSIREILSTLQASRFPPGEDHSVGERITTAGHRRLFRSRVTVKELPSLIDAIFSGNKVGETMCCLPVGHAQTFIDVVDEALHAPDLLSGIQNKCLKLLYRTCGHNALLPSTLEVPVCFDRTSNALYRGGYADVWKGKFCAQDVAVKVIRTYSNDDSLKIMKRFCKEVFMWRFLQHPNILPLIGTSMSENRFAMVSEWMPNGNINQFTKSHPEVNRPTLLAGVAKGLIYLHGNGIVHGDLKGANILIDETGQARLADFGLITIVSDSANATSSNSHAHGGTTRWMSPELIDPEYFGFEKSRATKSSDCYALGMVIYETISGNVPFQGYRNHTVSIKVVRGERPRREANFEESLWKMLESCWASKPNDRPSVEDVLRSLEKVSYSREPLAREGLLFRQAIVTFAWQRMFLLFMLILTPIVVYYLTPYMTVYL